MRAVKYVGTVLLVALAVVLMLFGVGAIMERLAPGKPLSQGQIDEAIQQSPNPPAQEPVMTESPEQPEAVEQADPAPVTGMNPAAAVHQYLADQPWYNSEGPGTSIVESVTVEDDDVIVRLTTDFHANATTNHAPSIVANSTQALRDHRDDPAIAGLDLLAVYSADGVMVGSDSISGRPQAAR